MRSHGHAAAVARRRAQLAVHRIGMSRRLIQTIADGGMAGQGCGGGTSDGRQRCQQIRDVQGGFHAGLDEHFAGGRRGPAGHRLELHHLQSDGQPAQALVVGAVGGFARQSPAGHGGATKQIQWREQHHQRTPGRSRVGGIDVRAADQYAAGHTVVCRLRHGKVHHRPELHRIITGVEVGQGLSTVVPEQFPRQPPLAAAAGRFEQDPQASAEGGPWLGKIQFQKRAVGEGGIVIQHGHRGDGGCAQQGVRPR